MFLRVSPNKANKPMENFNNSEVKRIIYRLVRDLHFNPTDPDHDYVKKLLNEFVTPTRHGDKKPKHKYEGFNPDDWEFLDNKYKFLFVRGGSEYDHHSDRDEMLKDAYNQITNPVQPEPEKVPPSVWHSTFFDAA